MSSQDGCPLADSCILRISCTKKGGGRVYFFKAPLKLSDCSKRARVARQVFFYFLGEDNDLFVNHVPKNMLINVKRQLEIPSRS